MTAPVSRFDGQWVVFTSERSESAIFFRARVDGDLHRAARLIPQLSTIRRRCRPHNRRGVRLLETARRNIWTSWISRAARSRNLSDRAETFARSGRRTGDGTIALGIGAADSRTKELPGPRRAWSTCRWRSVMGDFGGRQRASPARMEIMGGVAEVVRGRQVGRVRREARSGRSSGPLRRRPVEYRIGRVRVRRARRPRDRPRPQRLRLSCA